MNYYNEIKEQLINNEVYKKVKDYSKNKSDLDTYYNVGKLIIEAQGGEERAKYGDNLIKEYSKKLSLELGYKFNSRILWRARKFYLLFNDKKMSTVSTQLTWSHYVELLQIDNFSKINYYIKISLEQNLSVRELRYRIKNKEFERLDNRVKEKISVKEESKISDFLENTNIKNARKVELEGRLNKEKAIIDIEAEVISVEGDITANQINLNSEYIEFINYTCSSNNINIISKLVTFSGASLYSKNIYIESEIIDSEFTSLYAENKIKIKIKIVI